MTNEKPLGLAMILCDQIITEAASQKKTLVGIFNRIVSDEFPFLMTNMAVFVSLTNGRGVIQSKLICRHEDADEPVFGAIGTIEFPNPMEVIEIGFKLRNVPIPDPGTYCLEFFCDDIPVLERRFVVKPSTAD